MTELKEIDIGKYKAFPQYMDCCNMCKDKSVPTQRFDGFCDDIIYICGDCLKRLKNTSDKKGDLEEKK